MTRKNRVLTGGAVVLAAVAVAGGVVVGSSADEASPAGDDQPATTARVQRGELSAMVSLNGTLTYRARPDGSPYSVINQADGIYTRLPDDGVKVDCGDVLYRVDDHSVLLLCGTVPAYRDLSIGDTGSDVRQLNGNLRTLGYDADPADRDFTWKTRAALTKLQDDKHVDATGELALDDAVFLPGAVRIATVSAKLGGPARAGAPVAQATSNTLEVHVGLDASQQADVKKGDHARITLPGNRSVAGKVDRIGRVAQAPDDKNADAGAATIPAFIRLVGAAETRGLDRAPVQVEISTEGVQRALSVPVTALVGRSGGGFAVEVVRGGGRRELVAVELGLFDTTAGRVEVVGGVGEGDRVVVPSP